MEQEKKNSLVSVNIIDRVCFIEMQHPERLNCLSEQMCDDMVRALNEGYCKECVAIVIKAQCRNGVWSAGHDIRELPQDGSDPLAYDVPMERKLAFLLLLLLLPVFLSTASAQTFFCPEAAFTRCHLRHYTG